MAKIKVRPEDFIVEEIIRLPLTEIGSYTILKLEKRFWNTLDVIDFAARKLRVPKVSFARAGLKDRYSLSTQYLSFKGDLKYELKEKNFTLQPIGKSDQPVSPKMLIGNSFNITLRNLSRTDIEILEVNAEQIKEHGFPNYFDEQRFGSARHGQGFIAKKLILEHYAGALKLLMCYAYKEDGAQERRFKHYCLGHWRDWPGCLKLAPPFYRPVLGYLCDHPKDLRNAIKRIDKEYLNIYLLAYQSFLFNEVLARTVKEFGKNNVSVSYSMGEFTFHRELHQSSPMRSLLIPMINEKTKAGGRLGIFIKKALIHEGIVQGDMRLQKMRLRGVRFKPLERTALVLPKEFTWAEAVPDEIYKNKFECRLKFILPPGSYATIMIKRLLMRSNLEIRN